ncbi:unnamed protein product [Ixodes persulcatus]
MVCKSYPSPHLIRTMYTTCVSIIVISTTPKRMLSLLETYISQKMR